ncbi:CPBP family intramembrane glutamic endopeptidase [Phaeobacter sp. HF9A]|uniref:CPBP family intramembrane glutamic endopeptidase n=1 Tax=Phaeobacter sp. HF9A TaxID=2721561 RepID=UPI00142F697B|nr:CPBP family intramembrane glutamic endopeptidase [Phaeobacter sp. HF9A]NIZ14775.1 CPBP family intramembrane metalloprotease [Phaeobacter sp. HF9A]
MSYRPHETLLHEARERPELWRFLLGVVLVLMVWFALGLLSDLVFIPAVLSLAGGADVQTGTDPAGMSLRLGSFFYAILAVGLVLQSLHARSLASLTGPGARLLRQGGRVLRVQLVLLVLVALLPPYDMGAPLVPNLPFAPWLALLPLSLLLVLIQCSAEEILFRGYLQQGLAARFKSPLVWIGIPSALFGLGHYMPVMAGENAWLIVASSALYGVVLADLTARSGSLGPAIAVHFANNIWSLLVVATPTGLNGLALYLHPFAMSEAALRHWLLVDLVMILVCWLAARLVLRV